jgi:hypothetical protein
MAKQVSFDIFASFLYSLVKDTDFDKKIIVSVCAAAGASVLACIFSQPGDMVSHFNTHGTSDIMLNLD